MTLILVFIAWILIELANWREVKNNWDKYKCMPSVTPFSAFYGHNLEETMNFCIGEVVKDAAPTVINPIYKGINVISNTVEGVYEKAKSIEGGVSQLLSGFTTFLMQFANSFRLIGTRIRISLVKIRDIFDRVFGMFTSFALAGVSAITFGENLICNPIVTFIGTIAGVDICCFAPDTMIQMEEGQKPIQTIRIGDRLSDGSTVTSTFVFDGTDVAMVELHGVTVSANHSLLDRQMIEAGAHPAATPTASIPRLYCISTTKNWIPVIAPSTKILMFTDYEECSEPSIQRKAQATAEQTLNRDTDGFTYIPDFSLGIDGAALILLQRTEKPLHSIEIGDVLSSGSTVVGIVKERCSTCVVTPGGTVMSAAQLVFDRKKRRWVRATTLYPTVRGTYTLAHLILSDNAPISVSEATDILSLRDYMEVHHVTIQEPYDNYVKNLITAARPL